MYSSSLNDYIDKLNKGVVNKLQSAKILDVETTKTEVGFSFGSWLVGNPVLASGGNLSNTTDHNIEQSNKLKQKIENELKEYLK